MPFYKTSHKILLGLTIFFAFIAFISRNDTFKYWIVPTLTFGMFYLVDLMFFGAKTFEYEPDYNNWKAKCEDED
ncbi:unnamed protein product [Moneuplotes crassus]|uniref:Uncharacterized protein n=1 Tax=Euplotes crassus TaxID=5936 RepID=A0AAD2DAL7_EUPCR|nr:unnamed protein product [Moneuplotes crassus]